MSTTHSPRLSPEDLRRIRNIRRTTRVMEGAFRVPGTKKTFGIDPIMGLLPIGGDVIGLGISGYMIYQIRQLGAPNRLIARMLFNVTLDTLVGTVPLLGDALDFAIKSNSRNLKLLEKWLAKEGKVVIGE